MQTLKWEYYPLVAQNTLTRAFIEEPVPLLKN